MGGPDARLRPPRGTHPRVGSFPVRDVDNRTLRPAFSWLYGGITMRWSPRAPRGGRAAPDSGGRWHGLLADVRVGTKHLTSEGNRK
ncbi:predicted protein [Streptomyces viridosporus ATCC 14672]|uniref:Predicted protein n=1 Tax=Streptomyces viridosporus (strain ATCC 14672 / DSM 40746 / JCM 4963 / KCTC 9882 / NRRL B-12104 / FH 1290) TaxID=566461 RepID=D6A3Z5_STRV1|nr:predicted protein [Streptomyces viridosporus ATCC 14672]